MHSMVVALGVGLWFVVVGDVYYDIFLEVCAGVAWV